MKNLKDIIKGQNFLVNKKLNNRQDKYEYHPKTEDELKKEIANTGKKFASAITWVEEAQESVQKFIGTINPQT